MYRIGFLFLLSALLVASQSSGEHPDNEYNSATVRCAAEQNVSASFIHSLRSNLTEVDYSNPTIKCILLCYWKEHGLAGDDGKFNVTHITRKLETVEGISNRDGVIQDFWECSAQEGTDNCDTFVKNLLCILPKKAFREWIIGM